MEREKKIQSEKEKELNYDKQKHTRAQLWKLHNDIQIIFEKEFYDEIFKNIKIEIEKERKIKNANIIYWKLLYFFNYIDLVIKFLI